MISEVIALTRDQMRSNHISLTTELAAELKPVRGDKVQLQQVMLNLIVNAIDAMSAMPAGRQGLAIVSVNDGVQWGARRSPRFGAGDRAGTSRAAVRAVLYHQAAGHRHGAVDQPLDHRSPPGVAVGNG